MSTSDFEIQNDDNNNLRDVFAKWSEAVELHTLGKYNDALCTYKTMQELTARVLYNMAMAHLHLCDHSSAKKCLTAAIEKDERLAIAFYQRGLLNMTMKNYGDAVEDLESTRALLCGNAFINYRPLGLFCRIHIFQILYNLSLAYLHADDEDEAGTLLTEALYDADHAQKKHISDTVRLIKENRVDEIKQIPFTTDKVFAPPKAITCNLQSPASWKGSTVVFSANSDDSFSSWDAMKTVEQRKLSSSLKATSKKPFRKMKSMNDIKLPAVNTEQYDRRQKRHSTGNVTTMEAIRENRHSMKHFAMNSRVGSRRIRKHSLTLPEDSIIEMVEPPEYAEIEHDTTIKWQNDHENSVAEVDIFTNEDSERNYDEHHNLVISDSRAKIKQDTENSEIDPNLLASMVKSSSESPSQLHGDDTEYRSIDKEKNPRRTYRKAFSASKVENTDSELKLLFTKRRRSTGDLEKANRRSILPLENKKSFNSPLKSFKNCFGRRKSSSKNGLDTTHPTVLMSGCKSMADMFANAFVPMGNNPGTTAGNLPDSTSSKHNDAVECSSIDSDKCGKLKTPSAGVKRRPANTLGAVFGDKTSVVKYALTIACDTLTAVATPTIDKEDLQDNTEKFRRNAGKTPAHQGRKRRKSSKNKRAPSPPLNALATSLAATTGLFAAFAQLNFENKPENINDDKFKNNDNDCETDPEIVGKEQRVNDEVENRHSNESKTAENVLDDITVFDSSAEMNTTYCDLQSSDGQYIYDRDLDNHVDHGAIERTCSDQRHQGESSADYIDNKSKEQFTFTKESNTLKVDNDVVESKFSKKERASERGSKKTKSKKASSCARTSVRARKGSYRTPCFSFKRAKTGPPSYPPPILRPELRKRPRTSNRRKSSGRKKETKESHTESFSLGSALHSSISFIDAFARSNAPHDRLTQRISLSSISETDTATGARKSEDKNNNIDYIVVDDSIDVFEPLPTTDASDTDYQHVVKKSGSAKSHTPDPSALLQAFVKSNSIIELAFDNFMKCSQSAKEEVLKAETCMSMESGHVTNHADDAFYGIRGGDNIS